nr:FACT complex subunit SPT16-like [Ipomoea batatas]
MSAFYSTWRIHRELWGNSDIIVFSTPAQALSDLTRKFFVWLLGKDLAGTTAVFTPSSIFFLCTQEESFSWLRSFGGSFKIPVSVELGSYPTTTTTTEVMIIPVSVELKPDEEEEGVSKLNEIIGSMRLRLNSGDLTVGCIDKEISKSKLLMSCCVNDRISSVNCGVRILIDSRIYADNILQFNRGGVTEFKQNKKAAQRRVTLFYSSWRKYRNELWSDSDVLVVTSGSGSDHHPVSCSFFLWLLGRDFPNTTAVFMDQAIYFICPTESYSKLLLLGFYITTAAQVSVSVQPKVKAGDDEEESQLLNSSKTLKKDAAALWSDRANDRPVIIGYIDGEAPSSKVLHSCVAAGKLDETMFQPTNAFLKLLCEQGLGEGLKSLPTQDKMSLLYCNDAAKASTMLSNEQHKDELLHKPEEANQLLQEVNGKIGPHSTESKLLVRNAEPVSSNVRDDDDGIQNACKVSDDDWEIIHEVQQADVANNSSWGRNS